MVVRLPLHLAIFLLIMCSCASKKNSTNWFEKMQEKQYKIEEEQKADAERNRQIGIKRHYGMQTAKTKKRMEIMSNRAAQFNDRYEKKGIFSRLFNRKRHR